MIRLFVALKIPKEIVKQITETRKKIFPYEGKLKWEDDSKIHLTLKFIGEVSEEKLDAIKQDLDFLVRFHPIKCETLKFGFFFKYKIKPRILWLELRIDPVLLSIVDELNLIFTKYAIPIEKRLFKAHLTLLRIKDDVPEIFIHKFNNAIVPSLTFYADEISLMQSELSSSGSTYKEIKKYKLI